MRILVLNADYPRFLAWFYRRQPGLENASYATQMAARNASLFGVADFYSRNFAALGHPAAEIHVNNPWLQSAWAREHGMAVEPPDPAAAPGARRFRLAATRRQAVQADAEAAGPQGRLQPQARRAGREHPARADRGFPARSGAQPGRLSCRHRPDAPDQGHRQPDPDRPGRHRTVARRGLERLRSDDLAIADRR